ncbi:MAG: hypothetical protein HY904_09365 [Deltaproteobacteria bacterium]|nr:hypothetical protein [Deltaproteobacteria bacterium]
MNLIATTLVLALAAAKPAKAPPAAGPFNAEDYRLYCGWLTEVTKDENKGLSKDKQVGKVAKLAKVKPAQLKAVVDKGDKAGGDCAAIAKQMEDKARGALAGTPLEKRLESLQLDTEDPSHVVAYVAWKGDQEKLLEEEASLLVFTVMNEAPIVTTLSVRAVDPKDGETALFEGKIAADNVGRIQKERINSFADSMYIKWFDGVVWANPAAHKR